ncbi:hypothetical protein ADUPG1_005089, partial [Aduncisulcus paluster]
IKGLVFLALRLKKKIETEDKLEELCENIQNVVGIFGEWLAKERQRAIIAGCEDIWNSLQNIKVQSIKPFLPKIGEGWECPSIEDIVKAQLARHKGDSGCIVDDVELAEKASLELAYEFYGSDFDPLDI